MLTRLPFVSCCVLFFALPFALIASEFRGWQGLRVIEQVGRPLVLRAADIDGDGRQELLVVNSRYSRLDVYHWLPKEARKTPQQFDDDLPNELPMTEEVRREEIQLENLPRDATLKDLDADGRPELIILASPPNRILVYAHDEGEQAWQQQYRIDLLDGDIPARRQAMLVRGTASDGHEALVSCSDGIQRVKLEENGRAEWLTPREKRDRADWWLADLDGDGDQDLVEQTREAAEAIRWYPCFENGELSPARVLVDRATSGAEVLRVDGAAELILLDAAAQGLIRRYRIGTGEESPLGERRPLPLVGGKNSPWCGMQQGSERALIVADPNRPRLLSYRLSAEGWGAEQAYPAVSNIQAVAAPAARPETLLIWAKDAADLQKSRWNSERVTYPERWPQSPETEDRKILALAQVGSTTWWVQKVGSHLDLYRWSPDQDEPLRTRFSDVGSKADQVLWIGGDRLLVKDALARGLRMVTAAEGKAVASSPSHLDRATLAEFKLVAIEDEFRLGRMTEGVLQWLDENLQSQDQIMLPEGLELADYVADGPLQGWALQSGAPFLHRLEADESGIVQATDRIKVSGGTSLVLDAVLGLFLVNHDRITLLTSGLPRELELINVIDERVGRSGGVRQTRFHRIGTTDLDGDGCDELILFDDMEHRLSALACSEGELVPQIAWPVFDDKVYPYSEEMAHLVQEPRAICALDFEGDGYRDFAMLCHDRLLIYLGREEE